MKLLIVRHGDPDYTIDSLTEKGWREARISRTERLSKLDDKGFLCFSSGKSKRYSLLHPEKNEPHSQQNVTG